MARTRGGRGVPGFDPTAQETAWKAIQVLRGMMPQLAHFARAATGNPKVQVEITTDTPHTKGNKIFIRPPLGLASKAPHQRSRCGERDDSGKQICMACQIREVIDFYLFHEIAHVAGKTQIEASYLSFNLANEYINEWHHGECEHWRLIRNELDYVRSRTCDSMTLLNVLNPYLPIIFNVLEDCRVNRMTFMARPGMEHIFTMNMERLLTEGSEVGIDQYLSWSEAPLDSQFMIGLQMVAANYQTQDTLHPDVQVALSDSRLIDICNRALLAEDAHGIFTLSLEVFKRAQELGFCLVEKCVPEPEIPVDPGAEPEPAGDGGAGDDQNAEGSGDEEGDAGSGPESGVDSGSPESGEGDDESGSEGTGGSDDEAGGSEPADSGSGGSDPGGDDGDSASGGSDSGDADPAGGPGEAGSDSEGGGLDEGTDPQVGEGASSMPVGANTAGEQSGADPATGGMAQDASTENDTGEHAESANTSDTAGISGPGEQGASVQGSGELENQDGNARQEEMGIGDEAISSESRPGSNGQSGTDESRSDESDGADGAGDAEERPEAEDGEPDYPLDLESDNPWDIDNQEDIFDSAGSQQHGPMPTPTHDAPTDVSHGTPDDVARDLSRFLVHGTGDHEGLLDMLSDDDLSDLLGYEEGREYDYKILKVLELAINQVGQFDAPSLEVVGNEIADYPHWGIKWDPTMAAQHHQCTIADLPKVFAPPESLIGRVVLHSRRVFDDNLRAAHDRNRKSGRINTRVLGRRAPVNDPRLFQKKVVPAKRDYFVILGGDASFSTDRNMRNEKIKRTMHAQGDLFTRLGVPWAGYMHSAFPSSLVPFKPLGSGTQFYNYILPFKGEHEAWNDAAKEKLASVLPISDNLDGHSFEYYRKVAMQHRATDRIVIYFTDGQMPAANKDEELVILTREIKEYKRQGIHLVCVGIQTDSPSKYGLPTVRVDSDEDIIKVIEFIGKILTEG